MQLAAALAAQRQREAAVLAESYARRRAAKAEVMQLLAERKKHLAERLKERSAAVRAAAAGAPAVAAAAPGDVPGAAERREEGEGPKEAAEGTGEAAAGAQGVARPAVQLNLLVRADVQVGAGRAGVCVSACCGWSAVWVKLEARARDRTPCEAVPWGLGCAGMYTRRQNPFGTRASSDYELN